MLDHAMPLSIDTTCRSVKGLVSRGLVQEEKGTNKGDPYYKGKYFFDSEMHLQLIVVDVDGKQGLFWHRFLPANSLCCGMQTL